MTQVPGVGFVTVAPWWRRISAMKRTSLLAIAFASLALGGCATYDYVGDTAPGGYYHGRPSTQYYDSYGGYYGGGGAYGGYGYGGYG